jgi:hypothetical protein
MTSSPHDQSTIRPPHPLAVELANRLGHAHGARILDYCSGSGRNAAYLRRLGFEVVEISDDDASKFDRSPYETRFAGIASSHGLLHGLARETKVRIAGLAARLKPEGWMCATFGSQRDARFGRGVRVAGDTFASADGDEPGVSHAYFDERSLRTLLEPYFEIEMLEECDATQTAGGWAHATPLSDAVHWFFIGRRLVARD